MTTNEQSHKVRWPEKCARELHTQICTFGLFPTRQCMGPPPATSFSLRRCQPSTSIPNHSACLSDSRNSVLQRFLGPVIILPRVFASISCFVRPSVISRGVLWIVGQSSIQVQCFSWKGGPFTYKIQFFWYFLDFQQPVLVISASMTNKKPSGGVVCYYLYAESVGGCSVKIEVFSHLNIKNHLSLHLLLSLHSLSQVKPTHVLFPLPPHGSLTLEPLTT